jgi:hypothetical protein
MANKTMVSACVALVLVGVVVGSVVADRLEPVHVAGSAARPVPVAVVDGDILADRDAVDVVACKYFAGCGVLQLGPQTCVIFHADTGEAFAVGNTGEFFVGDRVYVTGFVNPDSLRCWPASVPAIENNTIAACFSGCGVLGRGPQNCTIVLYAENGFSYALDNLGDFFLGDYVYVSGPIDEDSLACWPVTMPKIVDNTIAACFSGCGVLAIGPQGCLTIHADSGEGYAVENGGDFFIGDYVHVSGWIDEDSLACWPASKPQIRDNTIVPCFSGCGFLGRGPQNCTVIFHSDDGPGYAVENLGDFFIGDYVYVNGPIDEDAMACWPAYMPKIEENTIDACPAEHE